MREYFLTPIAEDLPAPDHTQIKPRCFVCKKFPVCNIREDYLKTAKLIQNILGDPQEDFQLNWDCNCSPIIYGTKIANYSEYFPGKVNLAGQEFPATIKDAAYRNLDFVCIRYCSNEGYYIDFTAEWKDNQYQISKGKEVYYNLTFELTLSSLNELLDGLNRWRTDNTKEDNNDGEKEIINTTYFSAVLNCNFYEYEKGLTMEEGIRRIIAEFPDGVPLKDGSYYHLATFHYENGKVECFNPFKNKVAFAPMPYPVYVPPHVCNKKPIKRGEMSNENF